MHKKIKIILLFAVKYTGGFWLAKRLNRENTCVLCYHGFSYHDEHYFRPKLFMKPQTFAKRLAWLQQSSYQVIPLHQAIENNVHKDNRVVITMDDGWASAYELTGAVLAEYKLPVTLYVTSYYVKKQGVVVNVALAYILWKSIGKPVILKDMTLGINEVFNINAENINQLVEDIILIINKLADIEMRQKKIIELAKQLDVSLYRKGKLLFRMLNKQELSILAKNQVSIQLHTHHHCSPQDEHSFKAELKQNSDYIRSILANSKLDHFCYPDGDCYQMQSSWLENIGVHSATTVSPGMLTPTTNLFQIPRILDGEDMHQIEFEAELCGFMTYIRKVLLMCTTFLTPIVRRKNLM